MALVWIANGIIFLIACSILAFLCALIVRRRREIGRPTAAGDLDWRSDVFGQSWAMIRRSPSALALPIGAVIVEFAGVAPSRVRLFMEYSEIADGSYIAFVTRLSVSPSWLFSATLSSIVKGLQSVDTAMVSAFSAYVPIAVCLCAGALVSFRPGLFGNPWPFSRIEEGRRKLLGFAFGLAVLFFVTFRFVLPRWFSGQYVILFLSAGILWLLILPVSTYARAVILLQIKAAASGERSSIKEAMARVGSCFRQLFYLSLITSGIGIILFLPGILLMGSMSGTVVTRRLLLLGVPSMPYSIAIAMISFVSIIIVERETSLLSAFRYCIELWARFPRRAFIFVAVSALALATLSLLENPTNAISSHDSPATHVALYFAGFVFSLIEAVCGVFIVGGMLAFYRKINESQEEPSPQTTDGD